MENELQEQAKEIAEEILEKEHKKEKWLLYLSLTTTFMAVMSGIISMQSEIYVTKTIVAKNDAVLYQNKATDMWNYYQAKDMRYHMYSIASSLIGLENKNDNTFQEFNKNIEKYKKQKEEILQQARTLEKKVEDYIKLSEKYYHKHHIFMLAEVLMQLSIAVSSVSALTRNRIFWYLSLFSSITGLLIFLKEIFL